jgi:hypothetical protein
MRAMMLLLATFNGVGVNVRLVGYGLSMSGYQRIYINGNDKGCNWVKVSWGGGQWRPDEGVRNMRDEDAFHTQIASY